MTDPTIQPGNTFALAGRDAMLTELTAEIVGAYVARNSVPAADVPALILAIHAALAALDRPALVEAAIPALVPAVPVRKSVRDDHIVSLIDGKPYKALKRHLAGWGHTPDSYRAAYGLPSSYPMVAPGYARARSELAKAMGLGNMRRGK